MSKNTALKKLGCYNNQLTALDVSQNTALTALFCGGNQLTELDISHNTALTHLSCNANNLTSLDVSKNTALTYLDCPNNNLTSLDVSKNTALTMLACPNNNLTSLDVSRNTDLSRLFCGSNQLTELNLSSNTALTELSCEAQTSSAASYWGKGQQLLLDLASLVGAGNLSRVSNVTGGSYDSSTGIVTLDSSNVESVTYHYNIRAVVSPNAMDVTVLVTVPSTVTAPKITSQPQSTSAAPGTKATFKVVATGSDLSYQWQYRKTASGAWTDSRGINYNKATFTPDVGSAMNGYQYRCKISNVKGTVYSNAVTLTVTK